MKGKTMDITINNGHEEISTDGFGPTELVQALKITINDLTAQLEQSRQVAHEEAERAEARRTELIQIHEERMQTRLERWQADASEKQARIDSILETDQGKAYAEVEDMKRQVERATLRMDRAIQQSVEAEASAERAWASVNGSEDIDPKDPRVAHIWRKASRIATSAGFCTEYDRIADALGLPEIEFDYEGSVSVRVSAYVTVPVSGTATRSEIADGEVDWSISNDDIVAELDGDMIEWEVDEVDIEANDN
jgi:hypothetical protein